MPEKRFFASGNASIYIDAPGTGGGPSALGPGFVRALQLISSEIGKGISEIETAKPDEMRVRFGLSVSADGHFLITSDASTASFTVDLRWGGGAPAIAPPLPVQK